MSVFFAVIAVSVCLFIVASIAFVWSVRSNQYEDVERNGQDIFYDLKAKPGSSGERDD